MTRNIILCIDDDPAMTELLSMLLRSKGFDVLAANTSLEGIELARTQQPRLVLLDLMMPHMDGWEVCQRIRAFSSVPIVILSALDGPQMIASALDAGADDYLTKPVPSNILLAHINTLIRREEAQSRGRLIVHTGGLPTMPLHGSERAQVVK